MLEHLTESGSAVHYKDLYVCEAFINAFQTFYRTRTGLRMWQTRNKLINRGILSSLDWLCRSKEGENKGNTWSGSCSKLGLAVDPLCCKVQESRRVCCEPCRTMGINLNLVACFVLSNCNYAACRFFEIRKSMWGGPVSLMVMNTCNGLKLAEHDSLREHKSWKLLDFILCFSIIFLIKYGEKEWCLGCSERTSLSSFEFKWLHSLHLGISKLLTVFSELS